MSTIGDRRVDISALSQPIRAKLKEATSAEQVKTILAADGKIDAKEQKVLEEIEAELGQIPEDGNQTLTFKEGSTDANSVAFGKGMLKETQRSAAVNRLGSRSTEGRADVLRTAAGKEDIRSFLTADQKLAGTQADGSKTRYGASGPGASKVLLQDAILLEKFGLLTSTQKQALAAIVDKLHTVKGFQGGDGMHYMEIGTDAISKEDIAKLDGMVEDVLARLDGAEMPSMDYGKLNTLNSEANVDQQFQTVLDNLDGIGAESDALMHDLQLSYSERGGGSGGSVASNGRIFGRIQDSIQEVDQQLSLLKDQVLPSLERQLASFDQQLNEAIFAKRPDLKGKSKEEINSALALDNNLAADPAISTLREKKTAALDAYSLLSERVNQLSEAKVKGLTRMSELTTIVSEETERTSAVNSMAQKLGTATGDLQELQNQLAEIGKHAPAGQHPEKLSDYLKIAATMANQPFENLKSAEALKTKLVGIRNNMIEGMKGLIKTYQSSGTSNATAIQLLQKQLATLEALNTDNADQTIEVLEEVRQNIIGELGKQVGPLISKQEYMALTGLDKKVTTYSHADMGTAGAINDKIATIKEEIEEAKNEQKQSIERTMDVFNKFADEKLAYGTHAQVSLSVSVGLGLGTEDFGAYAGVGIQGTARIGKDFSAGPTYTATLDLDFIAEAKVKIPLLVDWEAKYSTTILSTGIGFGTMEECRSFISDVNRQLELTMNVGALEDALKNAMMPGLFESVDKEKVKNLATQLGLAKKELETVTQRVDKTVENHKLSNDKSAFETTLELPGLHAAGKFKREVNVRTYHNGGPEEHKVKDTNTSGQISIHHRGVVVNVQSSEQLDHSGQPTGHSKDRYGFYLEIPPADIGKLLQKGASLTKSIGKEALYAIAEKIVTAIGQIDPTAGLTSAFVVALLEKQWAAATATHAKDLGAVGHAAGHGGHAAEGSGFHQAFLVGVEFVYEDKKFMYAAVEAAYEASFKKAGRTSIPAGPIPLQARGSISIEAEVGVVVAKFKSNAYKAKQFMNIMHELKPGMQHASGAQMLQQFAAEPGLAADKKLFEYTHSVLKDLREKFPELKGLDDTQTMAKALENADKYLAGTFFADVLKKTGAEPGGH